VAGGLGERFDVDPTFIRIGFVIAALVTGDDGFSSVPFLYGLAWLLLPLDRSPSVVARLGDDNDARREAAGVIALVISAGLLLPRLGPGGSDGLRFGVVLLGVAVLLLAGSGRGRWRGRGPVAGAAGGSPGTAGQPDDGATSAADDRADARADDCTTPACDAPPSSPFDIGACWKSPPWGPPGTSSHHRRPRRGPALWPLTVALLVIYVVVCVALDSILDDGIRPGLAISGGLLIVGAVLVLSGWKGRARSTAFVGLALLPVWVAFSVPDVDRHDGSGERKLHPTTVAEAEGEHELGYGRLELDLRDVELEPGQVLRSGVSLTGGIARVVVPADAELVVQGPVGLGSVWIEGDEPWQHYEEVAVNRTVTWRTGPQPRRCDPVHVPLSGLEFSGDSFDSLADLTAELERREWEPPPPPRFDPTTGEDSVLVSVDERYALCDDSLPDVPADPATVLLDVDLGLANLEVARVPAN
jgi:phage shock protein PspC (stress-responsive transcriptional regulator)